MDGIKFIPKNQKNIEDLIESNVKGRGFGLIYFLSILFIIYVILILGAYWYFVILDKNKVIREIEKLDSTNQKYYITDNLDQHLFNISDLIDNYYDPVKAIKFIESVYLPGSSVSAFSYNKIDKSINISMTTLTLNDTTKQVSAFQNLPIVQNANLSTVQSDKDNGFSFNVQIILK
jgi:hypothetical protein